MKETYRLGDGHEARLKAGKKIVLLQVKFAQTGWASTVVELKGKTEVDRENGIDGLDSARAHAEDVARNYLADGDLKIPMVVWKPLVGRKRGPAK
jgi:hypothetical protein